jgi:uncharacterized protein (DUF362 family)
LITRRAFVGGTTVVAAGLSVLPRRILRAADVPAPPDHSPLKPIGRAKGIHPGRVVWAHDPGVLDWNGAGDGHWYDPEHIRQDRVDQMTVRAVCALTGESGVGPAWDRLFTHLNKARGKGSVGYRSGEKVLIKPNWVGMIWREGAVDPESYRLVKRQDYMNTAPQMIIALVRQLVSAGVKESDITVCDTLAYLVNEYHTILCRECPGVRYEDFAGKYGRIKVASSAVPLHWSCRPDNTTPDFLPTCITEAEYLVNFATLKAHVATGVTLCGKNHFGSLVRWPVEKGYYDMHRHSFAKEIGRYREQVDLLGHAHLGGKTVLNLIDGLFSGKHPIDPEPRRMTTAPFAGDWAKSLFASQDPIAIDSVGYDFLHAEYDDYPRRLGVDDYLHEAALADAPPSGTFYDPDHATPEKRLASLGVHEHWNNAAEKQYSRNLGTGAGIELVQVEMA